MKNTLLIIVITSVLTAAITLAGFNYFSIQEEPNTVASDSGKVSFAGNRNAGASSAGSQDFIHAASMAAPGVVHIKTMYNGSQTDESADFSESYGAPQARVSRGSGSGVLITADGYIITNNHVVENASQIEVVLPDRRTFRGKVIGTDPGTDLALVKIEGEKLPIVELGNSDEVQVGEWVLAVGYPFSLNSTVTAGIISAKGRSIGILSQPGNNAAPGSSSPVESFIQTDAAINPGNSGGALVNAAGRLIGINSAIASRTGSYAGYGFAIPVNLAKKIVSDFKKYGEVRRGYLGVSFPAPTAEDELLKQRGIKPGEIKGVYITDVQDGSAAAEAGLNPGDIIQSIDDTKVNSSSEFSERIARLSPGDKIRLTYLREGKSKEISVSLTGRDSSEPVLSGLKLQEKLGAIFAPLGSAVKQRYGLRSGIVITALQEGGVFEQAGIPRGTVITTVNGYPINTLEDLNKAFQSPKGGQIRIDGFTPDGARFVFNIPLGA